MKFDVITLFPEMFSAIKDEGIIARALKKSIIEINTWQLRDFTANKYKNDASLLLLIF
jgi:tRNA (guanine37-N1)-methyltransferase